MEALAPVDAQSQEVGRLAVGLQDHSSPEGLVVVFAEKFGVALVLPEVEMDPVSSSRSTCGTDIRAGALSPERRSGLV